MNNNQGSQYDLIWLDEDKKLGQKLENIRNSVKQINRKSTINDTVKCLHCFDHCEHIEYSIHSLLPNSYFKSLCPEERYFLLASPWVLNIVWSSNKYKTIPNSELYNKAILWLKDETNLLSLGINGDEAEIFREIVYYHDFSKDLENCMEKMQLGFRNIRVRLITAYLRLADAIHIDDCKGPNSLFYFLDHSNTPDFFHWMKSKLKPNLRLISPNPEKNTLTINIYDGITSDNIIQNIRQTIDIHIKLTKTTLIKYALHDIDSNEYILPCYLSTDINEQKSPAMQPEEESELKRLINEFEMSFSPNAGMLQTLYLSTINRVATNKFFESKMIVQEVEQLQNTAKNVYSYRQCHIALGRYINGLDSILQNAGGLQGKAKKIASWTKESELGYKKRMDKIKAIGAAELFKKNYNKFLIFGFSSTVINIFSHYFNTVNVDDGITIYVCEAHNKSRYDASGLQIYNDGQKYADQLRKKCADINLILIPDITISSIFKEDINSNSKWCTLFGANGITQKAQCGHSAGHLSLAIIANHFQVPVYLALDTYKIGSLPSPPKSLNESQHSSVRSDQWLKDIPNWEKDNGIKLLNFRESIIEPEMINFIITEEGVLSVKEFQKKFSHNE